jgi:hypothetical protein
MTTPEIKEKRFPVFTADQPSTSLGKGVNDGKAARAARAAMAVWKQRQAERKEERRGREERKGRERRLMGKARDIGFLSGLSLDLGRFI